MTEPSQLYDVVIIGAGPSGSIAAALLVKKGHRVLILEKSIFPRFSIGESLLPQSMEYIEKAGMLQAVQAAGFQIKNGAAFCRGKEYESFDFSEKISAGWGTTFQVQRANFDHILAQQAEELGAVIRWGHTVTAFKYTNDVAELVVEDNSGNQYQQTARFVLDASGFGRVLSRLLELEIPSNLEVRTSIFTHIQDNIKDSRFDRKKILITVHPNIPGVWFWLIPFSDGRSSVGVVAKAEVLDKIAGDNLAQLQTLISQSGMLASILEHAQFDTPVGELQGYSSNVSKLWGDGYALLGNAGEFLDPVFSSGVTIAVKSADLAVEAVHKHLNGEDIDWENEFSQPLKEVVDTFRVFVEAWYSGRLQDVIFATNKDALIKRMVSSILAGYAWDKKNPLVKDTRRLATLVELCKSLEE